MVITLTPSQRRLATYIGKCRDAACKKAGRHATNFHGDLSQEQIDIDSFGAELAFCIMANVMVDLQTDRIDDGIDCTLHSGLTVDVKQTRRIDGNLLVNPDKKADIFVLMVGHDGEYEFVGYTTNKSMYDPSLKRRRDDGSEYYFMSTSHPHFMKGFNL